MSANNPSTSRSRPPPPGFLSRVPLSELKSIRVAVRRGNITTSCSSPGPIERGVDDPKQIVAMVHSRKDEARKSKSIFDRDDVVVNQEERSVLTDTRSRKSRSYSRSKSKTPRKTRSRSSSFRRRSRSSSRSRSGGRRSSNKEQDRRKVVSTERRKSADRDNERSLDKGKRILDRRRSLDKAKERSAERGGDKSQYKSRPYSREREEERYRRRSRTPLRPGEYRPSHPDLRRKSRSRDREHRHDKYGPNSRRSRSVSGERYKPPRKSLSPSYSKPSTSRKVSRSPRRSITPVRGHDRPRSPNYMQASKSRRSRSPAKPDKPYYAEKRGRERSPRYKSPAEKSRRSRSPRYERDRNRSRSPNKNPESSKARSSHGRYDRYPRRHSRSPGQYDRGPPSKRSRSPHPPIVTFSKSRSDYRRSSRSPGYDRDRSYRRSDKHRSRSRTPRKHRSRSPHALQEPNFSFYEGLPGSEYWIPGPIRPGFPGMHRFYPPAFYPRIPGGPIILPPRIPMVTPYAPFRQRLPIYNSQPRHRPSAQLSSDGGTASGSAEPSAVSSTGDGVGRVTVQEASDTESHTNEEGEKRKPGDDSSNSLKFNE